MAYTAAKNCLSMTRREWLQRLSELSLVDRAFAHYYSNCATVLTFDVMMTIEHVTLELTYPRRRSHGRGQVGKRKSCSTKGLPVCKAAPQTTLKNYLQ